jgi:hypothetical protein
VALTPGARAVWSNFEIADLDFWRSPAYQDYFAHLDKSGGFYYEVRPGRPSRAGALSDTPRGTQRWGDAPVHSLAVALLLPKSALHQFDTIGARRRRVFRRARVLTARRQATTTARSGSAPPSPPRPRTAARATPLARSVRPPARLRRAHTLTASQSTMRTRGGTARACQSTKRRSAPPTEARVGRLGCW